MGYGKADTNSVFPFNPCFYSDFNASWTSRMFGMDASAPFRVTEMAEALVASSRASGILLSLLNAAKKYPVKVSPEQRK